MTKDLVEIVARAICNPAPLVNDDGEDYFDENGEAEARAAIAAVAEWLDENYRSCPCTLSCASILKLEQPK